MSETVGATRRGPARLWIAAAAGLLLIAFLALLGYGIVTREPSTAASGVTRQGKVAPDFELALFGGGALRLSDLRGKGVVLNFWVTTCPPCREEMPALNAAYVAHKERGVVVVGVDFRSPLETEAAARALLQEFQIQYPAGLDREGGPISLDYGVSGLPVTFFIDQRGVVVRRWVGPLALEQLEAFVAEIVPAA